MSDPSGTVRSIVVPGGAVTEGVLAFGRKEADRMDREKMLDVALAQIEKQYGRGAVMKLGEHPAGQGISVIPTGSMSLDIALGVGGLVGAATCTLRQSFLVPVAAFVALVLIARLISRARAIHIPTCSGRRSTQPRGAASRGSAPARPPSPPGTATVLPRYSRSPSGVRIAMPTERIWLRSAPSRSTRASAA